MPVCFECQERWRVKYRGSLEERFWANVAPGAVDDCWDWQGCRDDDGYGVVSGNGKSLKAHRTSWEIHHGPIPDGLWVLHHCDRPCCINPAHLFLGTARDNSDDKVAKGRQSRLVGEDRPVAKVTAIIVSNIRSRYASGGVTQQQLAAEYGITFQNVSMIVLRKTWKHVA